MRKTLIDFLSLTSRNAAIAGSIAALLAVVLMFGLPDEGPRSKYYVNLICHKIKQTVDPHLPCPDEIADGEERPTDRQALWSVIRTLCLPASYFGVSYPCLKVDRAGGYAILRPPSRSSLDFIITPTFYIEGIESLPRLHETPPNLWKAGWMSRDLLREAVHHDVSWNDIVLAVNSKLTRNQDQLHLHLGCLERKLKQVISAEAGIGGSTWRIVKPKSIKAGLLVKFLTQDQIDADLFAMINNEIPGRENSNEWQTIALAGVESGSDRGFVLMVTLAMTPAEKFLSPTC